MLRPKNVILVIIILLSVWAFWPPPGKSSTDAKSESDAKRSGATKPKYVLRVSPEFYMPGTMPWNVGEQFEISRYRCAG